MADITTINSTDTLSASRSTINTNFSVLQNLFRSATAPTSPVAGQLWLDTSSGNVLKIRNAANSAWVTLFTNTETASGGSLPLAGGTMTGAIAMGSTKITGLANGTVSGDAVHFGQVTSMVQQLICNVGDLSATATKLLTVCTGAISISEVYILNSTSIATNATNYWTFMVSKQGGSDLQSAALSTAATALTANVGTAVGINQNNTAGSLTSGSVLKIAITKNGSATALTDLVVVVNYTVTM